MGAPERLAPVDKDWRRSYLLLIPLIGRPAARSRARRLCLSEAGAKR
jgi:hypothetical protein